MKKLKTIPYGKQSLSKLEEEAVLQVLRSDRLTQGPAVQEFESAFCRTTKAKHAVAVSNGTAALHLVFLTLGLKKGDEVITSPISFIASSNSILYSNAKPVFSDIDPRTFCLDPKKVEEKITSRTKAILTVDMTGHSSAMDELRAICRKRKLFLIQDASHSLGAHYKGKPVGGLADMTTFSFHPVKSITTGEGGMITTNNPDFYKKLLELRSHGIVRNASDFKNKNEGPWYHEMQSLGFNYRITDIQCAMGVVQLRKLPGFIKRRREIVKIYQMELRNSPWLTLPFEEKGVRSAWHLFVAQIDYPALGITRADVFRAFEKRGILLQVHYIPIYKQPYYEDLGYAKTKAPFAEAYYEKCVSLPLHPTLSIADIRRVVAAVRGLKSGQGTSSNDGQ